MFALPCPFCGEKPTVYEEKDWAFVQCINEECVTWALCDQHGLRITIDLDSPTYVHRYDDDLTKAEYLGVLAQQRWNDRGEESKVRRNGFRAGLQSARICLLENSHMDAATCLDDKFKLSSDALEKETD